MNYNELNALIDAYVNRNGVQAITGQILNGVLKMMVEQLGRGYTIMGVADPTTDPGTPDAPESYFASQAGTYTKFGGIAVASTELCLLCYTPGAGWDKRELFPGIQSVNASIDEEIPFPSVDVTYNNGVLSFDFHSIIGDKGDPGTPADISDVFAQVDANIGTPSVDVMIDGPSTGREIYFNFHNLKGETGVTSVLATVDNTVGTPQCAVSLVGQQLTLAFTGLKGAQGDTGVSADYPIAIVNNLTTNDPASALSAAMGVQLEGEITQLEAKVTDLNAEIFGGHLAATPVATLNKCYVQTGTLKITDLTNTPGTWNFELYGYQVSKGQLAKINIPKAGGSGKVLSFSYILPAANVVVDSFVDGIANNQPLVDYVYTCPDDGYICVLYDTTQAPPTVELMMPDRFGDLEGRVEDVEEELASELPVELSKSEVAYVSKDTQRYVVTSSNYGCRLYAIEKGKKYGYYIKDTEGAIAIPVSFFEELPVDTSLIHSSLSVEGGAGVTVEGEFVATIDGYVCLCGDKALAFSLELIKGTIDQRFEALSQEVETIGENAVSRQELYSEGEVVYELPEELVGPSLYTQHTNLGLVHRAAQREVFNQIVCCICRAGTPNTGTFSVYKSNTSPNKNTAELLFSIENFSSENFAPANGLFTINLGKDVVLEIGEYLFTCFSGDCALYLYETATREDETEREGFIYGGSYNTYRYSSSMTLAKKKGDIVALWEAIEGEETETVRITLPDDLYCIKGKPQWFYYNNFIFGKESVYGNNIENLHIEARATTTSIGTEKEDGFCVEGSTAGDYPVTINIYDLEMNPITSKVVTVHISEPKAIGGSNILMLGDSWTDPSIPIAAQSPAKGYTAETDAALKELGLTLNFVGSIDCGVSGLKNEGRGGYAWDTYSKAPTQVRFKFFVETMPNVSIGDVYTNNGSSYTVFEKGDGYITMTRTSGTSIPSGNTLTKSSGSGDATITFTSYSQTTGNPFWNPTEGKVDFTYWRNLIGLEETLDFVTIQLGVNDCLGAMKTTKGQWKDNLDGASAIIDAILEDSPSCKVIVNLVGLDAPSNTGWSSLNGLSSSKATYQSNVYYLRKYINEMLAERDDFGTSVFIGQSVLGVNRWYGYEYLDARNVFFQIDPQTLSPTILNNLRNKSYTFFRADNVFLRLYGYDERGYAILRPFLGTSWVGRDQEFVGSRSDFDFSTIPATGNLVLDADHSVVIPYSAVKVENDNLKIHYFANATHPYARGYREMARTLAWQIVSI